MSDTCPTCTSNNRGRLIYPCNGIGTEDDWHNEATLEATVTPPTSDAVREALDSMVVRVDGNQEAGEADSTLCVMCGDYTLDYEDDSGVHRGMPKCQSACARITITAALAGRADAAKVARLEAALDSIAHKRPGSWKALAERAERIASEALWGDEATAALAPQPTHEEADAL